jgi:pimeloyl-ACP methyl ester carboxylesterase
MVYLNLTTKIRAKILRSVLYLTWGMLAISFATKAQTVPNYADSTSWAAHPNYSDWADLVPAESGLKNHQATAEADVFFVHPTSYLYLFGIRNARMERKMVNHRTDFIMMNQASVFNGSCRVFAPRYRQVSLGTFLKKSKNAQRSEAFDLAYSDVKRAFEYYLQHENKGRPIVIAGHSQGSYLAEQLLEDFFDAKPLQNQLVAAYLIGNASALPLDKFQREYSTLKPAQRDNDTGVVVGWNTFAKKGKKYPFYFKNDLTHYSTGFESNKGKNIAAINPMNWRTDNTPADPSLNMGATRFARTPKKFITIEPAICDAILENGIIRISRPRRAGYKMFITGDHHVFDYNLFYSNIRHNVATRLRAWQANHATFLPQILTAKP